MEIIKEIVRSIALILIFAGFMEMLLPDSEMRRYIQIIVGLFVIVSVLTPLAQLVNNGKSFEVVAWQFVPPDNTAQIVEKGQQIAKQAQDTQKKDEDTRIAAQINALAKLHNGIKNAEVDFVDVENQPRRVKVKLELDQALGEEEKRALNQKVSDTITAFFDYSSENIDITY